VVISTGCDTRRTRAGGGVLRGRRGRLRRAVRAPFGYASAFAPLLLFYDLTEGRSLDAAVARLRAHDRELEMWRLFRP